MTCAPDLDSGILLPRQGSLYPLADSPMRHWIRKKLGAYLGIFPTLKKFLPCSAERNFSWRMDSQSWLSWRARLDGAGRKQGVFTTCITSTRGRFATALASTLGLVLFVFSFHAHAQAPWRSPHGILNLGPAGWTSTVAEECGCRFSGLTFNQIARISMTGR